MDVPEPFRQFAGLFYQHGYQDYASIDDWIVHNFNALPAQERTVFKRFLDELLAGQYSDQDLADFWGSGNPSLDFRLGGHRPFFARVRDVIEKRNI